MDFEKVKAALSDRSIVLLDVRGREENKKERIPGAKNLRQASENFGALGWRLSEDEVQALEKASYQVIS